MTRCVTRCVILTLCVMAWGCPRRVPVSEPLAVAPPRCRDVPLWDPVVILEDCPIEGVCLDKHEAAKLARQVQDLRDWAQACRGRR